MLIDAAVQGEREVQARAATLAEQLGLRTRQASEIAGAELVLALTSDGLELRDGSAPLRSGAKVDFRARSMTLDSAGRDGHASRGQPLLRAVGRRGREIFDATAGFGDDAIALASTGRWVTAVERCPSVAALLEDGRVRALEDAGLRSVAQHLAVVCADSRVLLASLDEPPDVVYIDPMYPPKRSKSALPRLAIQLLRRLVGDDEDSGKLLQSALQCGAGRVVVKRPPKAPPLIASGGDEIRPFASHEGKLVRYDVYHPQAGVGRSGAGPVPR